MNSNKMEIYVKNSNINLLETPTNITYIVLPNKTDNINTVWIMSNHWLKVLGYDLTSSSSALERHGIPKITLKDLNELAIQYGYIITNPLKLPIRSTTQFMDVNSTKKILINSKQIIAQNIKSSDVDLIFNQLHIYNELKFDKMSTNIEQQCDQRCEIATTSSKLKRVATEKSRQNIKQAKFEEHIIIKVKKYIFNKNTFDLLYTTYDNVLWFPSKPITEILEYSNNVQAITDNVSTYNYRCFDQIGIVFDGYNSELQYTVYKNSKFINEAGLYELIINSKMPKAQEFKKWVVCDVLPSLRRTGHYSMQQASMNDAENLNTINRVIEGSNAAWFEEKIKLLEELREKDKQMHEKDDQMLKSYQLIQEKDGKIIHLQQKAIELKPLVVSVPEKANKFHVLELFSIRPKDGFMYGYFCSRRQQCTAMDARPLPEEEPVLLFSIKCANAINAYNCVKEELRSILNKCFITILNKRFYCNVNNENVIKLFENALSIKF